MRVFLKMVTKLNAFSLITGSRKRTAGVVAKQLVEDFPVSGERAELLSVILTNSFIGCVHNYLLEDEKTVSKEDLIDGLKLMCRGTIHSFVEAEASAEQASCAQPLG